MTPRTIGLISLLTMIGTIQWLVLMIAGMAASGPLDTFEQALAHVAKQDATITLGYLNAALITVLAMALMAGLYSYCKSVVPGWAVVALVFVPVYGVANLFAYLSQVTIVPALLELRRTVEYQPASEVLLRLTLQEWHGSAVWFLNNLGYAILGVPSLIFGLALYRHPHPQRAAGVLLALNGAACMLGVIGVFTGNGLLSQGSLVGGVLFLLALFPLTWTLSLAPQEPQVPRRHTAARRPAR